MTKKVLIIFIVSFVLNFIWENFHSLLYSNYMSGKITEFILFRATLGDAVMISVLSLPFLFVPLLKKHSWLIIVVGFILSVAIEHYALLVGRWSYNDLMPIIPFLSVGVTPAIQLGLLGYISLKISDKV